MSFVSHNVIDRQGRAVFDRLRIRRSFSVIPLVLILAAATALASSCTTIQQDNFSGLAAETDFARLSELADECASLRAQAARGKLDTAAVAAARAEAATLKANQPLNENYRARLSAISGDLALLAGDRNAAQAALAEAEAAKADEERVFLLRSRLARKEADVEAALSAGIAKAATSFVLKAELGDLRVKQGRYREAIVLLDEALPRLSEREAALYKPSRELALSLKDLEDAPKGTAVYAAQNPVSLLGLAVITQESTDLLDYLTGAKSWAPGPLFARLSSSGLFGPGDVKAADPATRARLAYFLWSLLAIREENRALLTMYSNRYPTGSKGPVPDTAPGSWYFDAALGCVEREILALPDGLNFRPDQTVSGAEALKALRKASE
jgi:hypothetical protein